MKHKIRIWDIVLVGVIADLAVIYFVIHFMLGIKIMVI